MPDFSLLQSPNYAALALGGYNAGTSIRRQQAQQAALSGVDLEKPETLYPLLRNPDTLDTGVALLGAASKAAAYKAELAGKAAHADYLAARDGLNPVTSSASTTPATPSVPSDGTVANAVNGAADSTVVPPNGDTGVSIITAPKAPPQTPLQAAAAAYARLDPNGYEKSAASADTHHENVIKFAKNQLDLESQLLGTVKDQASYTNAKAQAQKMGLDVSNLPDAYNPQIVGQLVQSTLTAKDHLDQMDKDRTFAEMQKQHGIENGLSAQRVGLESANVGLARQRLNDEEKGIIGANGKPLGGVPQVLQRIIPGPNGTTVHAYQNPANGKWYDNPEFK